VPIASVNFCGRVCYGVAADGAGRFVIPVGAPIVLENFVLHVSGRPGYADTYQKLGVGPVSGVIALADPVKLGRVPGDGPALPADGSPAAGVTSGDVTLHVAAGTTLDLDIGDVVLGDKGRQLRVGTIAPAAAPSFLGSLPDVIGVYAVAPSSAHASKLVGLSVKNTSGAAAGAPIDVHVLDDDLIAIPPTGGALPIAASAHVSADGAAIDTDPGAGVTTLTWIVLARSQPTGGR
jgi:hypothetical protein